MYEDDSSEDDGGRRSAMRDHRYRTLRTRHYRRPEYEDDSCLGRCRESVVCQALTSKKFLIAIVISLLIIFTKYLIDYEVPYCTKDAKTG